MAEVGATPHRAHGHPGPRRLSTRVTTGGILVSMLHRFFRLERRAALLLTGLALLACSSDDPASPTGTSQSDPGDASAGSQAAGGAGGGLSGSSGHGGASPLAGVSGTTAGVGPAGQGGAGGAGAGGASGQGGGSLDPLDPCQPGAPCLPVTYCAWYSPNAPNISFCSCGKKGVFECEGGLPTSPCTQGESCQGPSSCHVESTVCTRSCECVNGAFECSEGCQPDVCKQQAGCNLGTSCTATKDGCTTTCDCDAKGYYNCVVACPSCPGPTTPACGDPCTMPGPPDACQCTYQDRQKASCFCGQRPGEEPRYLCCEGGASNGKSCAGYPVEYTCGNVSTVCICSSDGLWHCGWSD